MGKRSEFERNDRDFYPTPEKAVAILANYIQDIKYIEPCAGNGALIKFFDKIGDNVKCIHACDIEPQPSDIDIIERNMLETDWDSIVKHTLPDSDMFITNPPWVNDKKSGYQLNTIIKKLSSVLPTWLLMNGNYCFNRKSAECMRKCTDVVPVGRLRWIENSPHMGKDDVAWFRFDSRINTTRMTYIHPRS